MAGRKDNGLTPKQLAFCRAYVETGNASEAYRRAFDAKAMKPDTIKRRAFDLMQNGHVKATVASLKAETDEKATKDLGLTREWIISRLMKSAQMGLGEVKASVSKKDRDTGEIVDIKTTILDQSAANQALGLLGKIDNIGLFVDQSRVTIETEFADMTDEELERYVSGDDASEYEAAHFNGKSLN
jgi:hypothetical protein